MHRLARSRYAYWLAFGLGFLLSCTFAELTWQYTNSSPGMLTFASMALMLAPMALVDRLRKTPIKD